jgi:hypothetical protein
MIEGSSRAMTSIRDECLVDSGITNTILKSKKYFSQLSPVETHVNTISGISNLIEGSRSVTLNIFFDLSICKTILNFTICLV